jgi:hypothetical protein
MWLRLFGLQLLCLPKKVGKESGFTPLTLKRITWLATGNGASGIRAFAHSASVTRQSFFRRRCARRRGRSSNIHYVFF